MIEDRIEKAVRQLQDEPAPPGAKSKLMQGMTGKRRRVRPIRWVVAGATTVLSLTAILLWPQERAMAWEKVVQATLAHTEYHSISYRRSADGKGWTTGMEEWVDGDKYSFQFPMPTGYRRLTPAKYRMTRRDGKRFFYYPAGWGPGPAFGVVSDEKFRPKRSASWRFSIAELLKSKWLKLDGQPERTQLNGADVLKYSGVNSGGTHEERVAFYADPKTGILTRSESYDLSGQMTSYTVVETPASIPASQFEPPAGIEVVDADKERAILRSAMEHGISFGHGNVLRAALGGHSKYLTLAWTGTPPNSDGTPHARFVGAKILHFGTSENYVLNPDGTPARFSTFEGEPVYTLSFELDKPLGTTVTLDLPVLTPDKSKPIRDRSGAIAGYRSKQVGIKRLANVRLVQTRLGLASGW